MRIALDAMGGDHAPAAAVEGAAQALADEGSLQVLLVGDEAQLAPLVAPIPAAARARLRVVHTDQAVDMHDSPVEAYRQKPRASIFVATKLVREGAADGVVSAGHTGAAVAAASLMLRLLPGIKKPGIAVRVPALRGMSTVLDVGANIKPKAVHLLHYALMGSIYHRLMHDVPQPRVGLLNIGEEEGKGNDLARETHALLAGAPVRFIGNAEGQDIFSGAAEVFVCDGFVGNLILKVCEGFGACLATRVLGHMNDGHESSDRVRDVFRTLDYAETGGAPLLGVDGAVVIAHGRSNARAVANAIKAADRFAALGINREISRALESLAGANGGAA